MFSKKNILILFILLIGLFLRLYHLDWGYPYFFHPDENNITNAILQMSLKQLNPHFFAYGGLPIYITFFIASFISFGKNSFAEITYTLRGISAVLSFLLLPSIFFIGKKLWNKEIGTIAALLACVGIGFIQFAHFGTFEMWLTFFTLWFFYFCFILWKKYSLQHFFIVSLLAGILMSIKVSSIFLFPLPLLILLVQKNTKKKKFLSILFYLVFTSFFYVATNPFFILDTKSFINSLSYESSVAVGTLPVFYTQSFLHTLPVIYQLQHVLPFLLNPIVFCVFLISLFFILFSFIKQRKSSIIFLLLFFLITFLSQAFLFVKWTRYLVPTLPFIYFFIALTLSHLNKKIQIITVSCLFLFSLILAIAFVQMTYGIDSRIAATDFAKQHKTVKPVIMEPYDLGSLTFTPYFPNAQIVDIYNLEDDPTQQTKLASLIQEAAYIVSPSQRLIHSRLANPKDFPKGNAFYKNAINGKEEFHIAYQTPCNIMCKVIYLGNPLQGSVEETATVFDHPFVTIFARQ